ncbi:PrsW family glutamic-type intramembrane protease [Spirillospora sp. NPDC029432]|uniref:PrsW family intramembrane metalloprotease n=1 Tax=Spirillospora sp. NPDC029432 TaxID=3154599 RepID=UPI0034557F6F
MVRIGSREAGTSQNWQRILWIGLTLWAATVVVTLLTANTNLVPTVILLGSFLVPVTFVVWAYEHGRSPQVTVPMLFRAFVVGGVLGVLGAALLEAYLLRPSLWMYVGVGLIEEAAKLAALLVVARNLHPRTMRDGLVLGATVGFGFAAFESSGYAFNAMLTVEGLSLGALVETEVLRGLLAPVGHGLWTAILGGVAFAASDRRWRVTPPLVGAYLGVSLLHALWDSMHGIAIALTLFLTGSPWQTRLLTHGHMPEATTAQGHLITALDWGGLVLISLVALVWLWTLAAGSAGPRVVDGVDRRDLEPG